MAQDKITDPTTTAAWARLAARARNYQADLPAAFASDPERGSRFSFAAGELQVDLSKNLIDAELLSDLLELYTETEVGIRRDAMFAGAHINTSEDRAVLHTALRRPAGDQLKVDGQEVVAQVQEVLNRMYAFADQVRDGTWTGSTGKPITTVINIGIGGSDLGPVLAYQALRPYGKPDLQCRFISNIDPAEAAETLADVDPETALFIVASKTFTTWETLTNARLCRTWLLEQLAARGESTAPEVIGKHFVAVSSAVSKAEEFGIDPSNTFGFWDWVGGRYSVGSAVGLSLAIAIGRDGFAEFLRGFHVLDTHFTQTPAARNVPVLMGLINIWYTNFLGAETHAILPYSHYLARFPAYLQQLTMESNGKSVRADGAAVDYQTGEIYWGEPGTNGQHAFYQLIHQGTRLIPADFLAFANPPHPLRDGEVDVHEILLANFFAQTKALAFGKTADQVRAEGTAEDLVSARTFSGSRPSTSIIAPQLSPSVLGQLIALYEHVTFVQGAVWGINSFDQWGVELGKQLAQQLTPAVSRDTTVLAQQDSSTRSLIGYYHQNRQL